MYHLEITAKHIFEMSIKQVYIWQIGKHFNFYSLLCSCHFEIFVKIKLISCALSDITVIKSCDSFSTR